MLSPSSSVHSNSMAGDDGGRSVRKAMSVWLPSQKGRIVDAPQRQSATVFRDRGNTSPFSSRSSTSPRTISGPFGHAVTDTSLDVVTRAPGAATSAPR
ncbi:hypothetical protein ASC66_12320 [Leifsonia sp. Root4]|nr:hypothetical protein ASC66_12320 [Leifsonia sp. Root4]